MNADQPDVLFPLHMRYDLSAKEASAVLLKHGIEGIGIVDTNDELIGWLSSSHLLNVLAYGLPADTPVYDIMTHEPGVMEFISKRSQNGNNKSDNYVSTDDNSVYNIAWSFMEILYNKNKEWQNCLDSIYNPVIAVDRQGQIAIFNQALEKMTGISAQEARGRNVNDVFSMSELLTIMKSGQTQSMVKIKYNGKTLLSNRAPVAVNGEIRGAVAVLQDISDVEKVVEELEITKRLNKQLDAIIDSSYDGLYITDGNGKTLRINKAFERITGITAQECIGLTMEELVQKGTYSRSGSLLALEKREPVTTTLQASTGKTVLVTSTPIFDDENNIVLVVTNVRDMTELVELECKLQDIQGLRERELDAIIESSYDGLYITDGEGNTLRLNRAFERITGVEAEECVGRNMADLVKEGIYSRSGTLLALEKRGPVTIPLQSKTNKTALVTSTPIFDDHGNIVLVVTNVRDMTELVELEQKLEDIQGLREKELDAIFDSSYDGLYITDGQGNTLRLNTAFERITGVSAEECVGRNMADLVKESVFSRSGTVLALEKKGPVTIPLQSKTGKNALVTSTPILDEDGSIILVVTNVRDLTELNHLQGKLKHLENLSRIYRAELSQLRGSKKCVYQSHKMRYLMDLIHHIASVDSTVLIQGESGVGKEVIADILHENSTRKNKPFIKVNCGAIPYNLLESELFGYEAGAFSGASRSGKAGMFELADEGTLFLDEISEMPLDLQVKLLRVLQDNKIRRVGGTKAISINVRILAGTNRNLQQMVIEQKFRQDLFYRLNVVPINIPPLRERTDDIPVLVNHFLELYNQKHNLHKKLTSEVIKKFMSYDWPGNVRELENLIERLVVTTQQDIISINDISNWSEMQTEDDCELIPLTTALENTERRLLQKAFSMYKSTYAVARVLGVSQPTVVRKAAKYGISNKKN